MILLIAAVVGAVVTAAMWSGVRSVFARPVFQRRNVRGRMVPVGVGILLAVAATVGAALVAVADAAGVSLGSRAESATQLTLFAALGFSMLGLFDDLAADEGVSGYRGHLLALFRGRLSAGSIKLFGGAAVALVVVAPLADGSLVRLFLDGALVALCANLANLLDRAPGRVIKVATAAEAALIAATLAPPTTIGVVFVGASALALGVGDLREQLMLGDAGANVLGATVGLGVVLATSTTVRTVVLAVVLALNLLSEVVSFSALIRRTPPLRLLDEWGRELP